jgi:hypothetical protein
LHESIHAQQGIQADWLRQPLNLSDAKRLKALEAENAKLKKLLAESLLEVEVVREVLRKKL